MSAVRSSVVPVTRISIDTSTHRVGASEGKLLLEIPAKAIVVLALEK